MPINFREITLQRRPGSLVEFDWTQSHQGIYAVLNRIVVFGLRDNGLATIAANTLVEVTSGDHCAQIAGRRAPVTRTVRALKKVNATTPVYVVLLDQNPAGAAAQGALTLAGPASRGGTISVRVDGLLIQAGVTAGDSAATMATALAAAINANEDLAVAAAIDGENSAKVNVTARLKGEWGNWTDLRVGYDRGLDLPGGVGVTITAMAGGTANPDVTAAVDALANTHYTHIVWPFSDFVGLSAITDSIEARWNANSALEAQVWSAATGSYARLTTLGAGLNSEVLSIMAAGLSPTPPHAWAGAYGGIAALRLNIDPARQLRAWELAGCLPAAEAETLTDEEREWLLWRGLSTHTIDLDGTCRIERAITTRQTNAAGLPENGRLDVTRIAVAAALRQDIVGWNSTEFPDYKLAKDGAAWPPGMDVLTPKTYKGRMYARAKTLWRDAKGWVEDVDGWWEHTTCEVNPDDPNRLDMFLRPDIINNAIVFAHKIQPTA